VRFLNADKIFDGKQFLAPDTLLVLDEAGRLTELVPSGNVESGRIERLEGIITPGFVNSHCHLELSHLKGQIPRHTGLPEFAKQVIISRNSFRDSERMEHMHAADAEMWRSGIVAVGDISNGAESFGTKAASPLFYHTFIELIGLDPFRAPLVLEKGQELKDELKDRGLRGSLAPHAPYSTSKALIGAIAAQDEFHKLPFSIHNQESEEETKFFIGQKNGFEDLYSFLGLSVSWFRAPGHSSLKEYAAVLPNTPSLLVHNTVSTAEDLRLVASLPVFWCFCPSANLYIEAKLPDFTLFSSLQNKICLGTDSLASNDSLNLVKEASIILEQRTAFSLETMLGALTLNGAEALGISENFGRLIPGKNTGLNLLAHRNSGLQFVKKIT
jgi:cytosine/adenosine deaminase-related metal-dependent hydrolase